MGIARQLRRPPYPGTKMWYGTSGNSFVVVVEFGTRIRARAVTCGGESGNSSLKHFNDEAERYASGNLRDVYFYPDQLKGHAERTYHPGEYRRREPGSLPASPDLVSELLLRDTSEELSRFRVADHIEMT